ncbi:21596_t:CDS:2, partial [Racocetra persica]
VKCKELTPIVSKAIRCKTEGFGKDSESKDFYIKVYDTVHLKSGEILRTSNSFQGKEWFSNVSVSAAEDQVQYESDK